MVIEYDDVVADLDTSPPSCPGVVTGKSDARARRLWS
jgi:hypothetical protein